MLQLRNGIRDSSNLAGSRSDSLSLRLLLRMRPEQCLVHGFHTITKPPKRHEWMSRGDHEEGSVLRASRLILEGFDLVRLEQTMRDSGLGRMALLLMGGAS